MTFKPEATEMVISKSRYISTAIAALDGGSTLGVLMNNIRPIAAVASVALMLGATIATTAGTSVSAGEELTPVDSPLISQQADGYEGKWKIDGGVLYESFEENGAVISTGTTSLQPELAAGDVVSFGFVGGYGNTATGENYAQLSGQAGDAVTAVRIISASGTVTPASLADGIWGAVWVAGDDTDEYGDAVVEFDTAAGTTTVSTLAIDAIAAREAVDQG